MAKAKWCAKTNVNEIIKALEEDWEFVGEIGNNAYFKKK